MVNLTGALCPKHVHLLPLQMHAFLFEKCWLYGRKFELFYVIYNKNHLTDVRWIIVEGVTFLTSFSIVYVYLINTSDTSYASYFSIDPLALVLWCTLRQCTCGSNFGIFGRSFIFQCFTCCTTRLWAGMTWFCHICNAYVMRITYFAVSTTYCSYWIHYIIFDYSVCVYTLRVEFWNT